MKDNKENTGTDKGRLENSVLRRAILKCSQIFNMCTQRRSSTSDSRSDRRKKDVVGIAQTGTGKRLHSVFRSFSNCYKKKRRACGCADAGTRTSSGGGVYESGASLGIRTAVLVGGMAMVRNWERFVVIRPSLSQHRGALIDHLEQKTLSLKGVSIMVLDEADRMLDMGFWPQVKKSLPRHRQNDQTMLSLRHFPARSWISRRSI